MIITASQVLTMAPDRPPLVNGALAIKRGTIVDVGPAGAVVRRHPGLRILALGDTVLMPGLVNLHTHLELPALLDRIRTGSFSDWILRLIAAKKDLTADDYRSAAQTNIAALIRSGTTTVGEICTHGISPALLKQSGLRTVIYRELISMLPKAGPAVPQGRNSALITWGISPHAPYTVSESILRSLGPSARTGNRLLAMHVAESRDELRLLLRRENGLNQLYRFARWDPAWAPAGSSSFEYLDRIGLLSRQLLAVHAVHITDQDIERIKRANVPIVHCPRSNRETGAGTMPLKKLLKAGITVGLGTDSLASSPSLSLWDEMRYAHMIHSRHGISDREILTMATLSGARALGKDRLVGSLTRGKKADIIALRLPIRNSGDLYADIIRETDSSCLTMVNGHMLHDQCHQPYPQAVIGDLRRPIAGSRTGTR